MRKLLVILFLLVLVIGIVGCDSSEEIISDTHNLTIEVEGEGTVEPAKGTHEFDEGATVDIKAIPDEEWEFSHWEGEVAEADSKETTVLMDEDKTVIAVFIKSEWDYTLTINIEGDGETKPSEGTHGFDENTVVDLKAIAAENWKFKEWLGEVDDSQQIETAITMNDHQEITAVFELKDDKVVEFKDNNLEEVIRKKIDKPTGDIYLSDVILIEELDASGRDIESIEGIQYLENVKTLHLGYILAEDKWNMIKDISPLSKLSDLKLLDLNGNLIADVSSLSGLDNLQVLKLESNSLNNIEALSGLNKLKELSLGRNNISDVSPLSNLNNLEILSLYQNEVNDILPLTNLINLKTFGLSEHKPKNIEVISEMTTLENLSLGSMGLVDISFLSELKNLKTLGLSHNKISSLSSISELTKLKRLSILNNEISDISPLYKLTNLELLHFTRNNVSDISTLANLTNLELLVLSENEIKDISVLSNLNNLILLIISNNEITDISPLVDNDGFNSGDRIDMTENHLDITEGSEDMTNIQKLKDRGVNVEYDPQRGFTLTIKTESKGTVEPGKGSHTFPKGAIIDLIATPDEDYEFSHWEGDVDDTDTSETTITLDTDKTITAVFEFKDDKVVEFEDNNLEEVIREKIDKPEGDIYLSDVIYIEELDAAGREIESIEGIQYLENLRALDFSSLWDSDARERLYNNISDISPISNLTKLNDLKLNNNKISNISALENLTKLQWLRVWDNEVSDIRALEDLTNLRGLDIGWNKIADISSLENLTNLQWLVFNNNKVSEINILGNMTNLVILYFYENEVSDISILENLTNLDDLFFDYNKITEIKSLEKLTNLKWLSFRGNEVEDISSLEGLINLQGLNFKHNKVDDITPLVDNVGFGTDDYIDMRYNFLDITEGSDDRDNIQKLIDRGLEVEFDPQREAGSTSIRSYDPEKEEDKRYQRENDYFEFRDYQNK